MNSKRIGERGVIFQLEPSGSTAYLIIGAEKMFLCDTDEGPISMDGIKQYIVDNELTDRELTIFNSHSDWDHIWGNGAFEGATIIAHELCRKRMEERGEFFIEILREYHKGKVELVLPNLTFDGTIRFEEEEVEFVYAPGHTVDSAICIDWKDSIAYVGDLVEAPVPFLNSYDLESFVRTLEYLLTLPVQTIVTTHSGIVEKTLIEENLAFVRGVLLNEPMELASEVAQRVHRFSLKNIMLLRYDDLAREKLGERWDFKAHRRDLWELVSKCEGIGSREWDTRGVKYEDLERALEKYMERF